MIRRFNYTGRRRIRQEDVVISVQREADRVCSFSAQLLLERYRFPSNALVFVEASRLASFMRFSWGLVRLISPPRDRILTEFGTADGVKFRVKVVEATGDGGETRPARVLGLADNIRPRLEDAPTSPLSLIDVVPADLGDELWKVEFSADDEPKLLVNSRLVASPTQLVRDDHFVSMALPQLLRTVLTQILMVERFDGTDDGSDWQGQWLQFAKTLPGMGSGPPTQEEDSDGTIQNVDELEEWIDQAARTFSRKFHIDRRFDSWWNQGDAA
jgi:hypothetical protein